MPFVMRKVEPRHVCRGHVPAGSHPGWPVGAELEAVANGALTSSLKQLASLLTVAEDIFANLTAELAQVAERSGHLRHKLDKVEERLGTVDPKKIPVPRREDSSRLASAEMVIRRMWFDLVEQVHSTPNCERTYIIKIKTCSTARPFSRTGREQRLMHRRSWQTVGTQSVPYSVRETRPVGEVTMVNTYAGNILWDGNFITRIILLQPAAIEDLRRWTSTEALGDVTVPPDCASRILGDTTSDDAVDHKLPSPEEQVQAIALKFPAEIVAVDVSGRGFERMSMRRRSLLSGPETQEMAVKRRSRPRRPRGKRRNTIAGTDQKEIRQAIGGETTGDEPEETMPSATPRAHRSASTDVLGSMKKDSPTEKKSHFNTLKAWGMSRLKLISPKSSQQQQQQESTTTASIGTSSTSLSHMRRLKGRDTSASSSVTSEGTLTPDIIQDITVVPFSDDGETSSVYSCDTEGYYTSFHVDSGLKTLREEEPMPQSPLTKTNDVGSDPTSPIVENEYELFGRGSTSTTTSSAGTVCTALMAPPPPERKSSLTVVAMVHGQNGGESPDSGHNTSSSPVESASSPACTGRSYSEFEYSESSDLEGCERIERIRSKTAITSSRIPSMCVITPPVSDDEHARETDQSEKKNESRRTEPLQGGGSVLMSATVGTSKMEVINGQDKNLYATVQVLPAAASNDRPQTTATIGQTSSSIKISPLSGVLGKLRGVLPGKKHITKNSAVQELSDSGDYVTIADVRNNNDKHPAGPISSSSSSLGMTTVRSTITYANSDIFKKDAEYVSLSELPKKPDSSLERKRQGARVTLNSEGKVVYSSDSLKRRKGAHTTFNPGPFVREGLSPSPSPLLHRAIPNIRAVTKNIDVVDAPSIKITPPTSPQLGKLIIRAARSPDRATSPDYVRTPTTVVGPTSPNSPHRQVRGAYVNVQGDEGKTSSTDEHRDCRTGRLEVLLRTLTVPSRSKDESRQFPDNLTLAPSNKLPEPDQSRICHRDSQIDKQTKRKFDRDENHPPMLDGDAVETSVRTIAPSKVNNHPIGLNSVNSRLDFEKSGLYPKILRVTGNTPKLGRKLLISDLDTPSFCRKNSDSQNENTTFSDCDIIDKNMAVDCTDLNNQTVKNSDSTRGDKTDRKVKRSESYRMANSPIMFIKKLSASNQTEKSFKICRTPSEELQEELLKERINYPETVSSPEPRVSNNVIFDNTSLVTVPLQSVPTSPRPRTLDLEPARVLKYSNNTLLTISPESIPPQAIVQPPPYIAPPRPENRQKSYKYQEILKDTQPPKLRTYPENEKQPITQNRKQDIYDSHQNIQQYDNGKNLLDQQRMSNYEYQQRVCNYRTVHMHNAMNQKLSSPAKDINQQQFHTLPTRRPQRELEPPRSVTPDITRGLGRGSLSSMHMLAKQSQQRVTVVENEQARHVSYADAGRRNFLEQGETRGRFVQSQPQSVVDVRNRFATPLNQTALGYRFFASSPANDPLTKSPNADVLRNNPISPIGHGGYDNGFKSSTPTNYHGRSVPTVAERLALTTTVGNNCPSPVPTSSSSGRSTPIQTSSGRTTPTNLVLSPTKSTMSNEELFTAIHKSKKKLNIKLNENDTEDLSPCVSMNFLVKTPPGTRHSWSPESQKASSEISTTVQSPTSRMDFKRLLLQQSVKANPMRLSAAEQLKLSRQQCQQPQPSSPNTHQNPLTKVLSPRSVWRFQTPRTDVLSSTIIEDTAAEEKAMKPSPENTSPISKLNSRRQLDLCIDLPSHPRITDYKATNNDRLKVSINELNLNPAIQSLNQNNHIRELITSTFDNPTLTISSMKTSQDTSSLLPQNENINTMLRYSKNTLESKNQDPVSALESRRISNQLARAQFLASTPTSTNSSQNLYFSKRFRARSESPRHAVTQNVAPRSPSAPTLETAL
ncbi:Wiskott-Aldrich syndrome protein family member 3 [Cyphomyrmex costatus]|uniref:Wiskott-Aldrich syndrome protein family member 3 n=1 Tax=Cyphomyrmex costatus TaxID=456900 RepID=A0A195D1F7_9HYME|nr:Wiskott-Aldrich syndrome protein family member 3 [Cyphomyrmex costatus]